MEMQLKPSDFYDNAIIPPPEGSSEPSVKYTRIIIDSKDRNIDIFPDPNSYEIRFEDEVEDVLSAQLVSADIPLPMYLINKYFKTLKIKITGVIYIITLDEGNFDTISLATNLTNSINKVITVNHGFAVEYNSIKDNYIFKSPVPFSLMFTNTVNPLSYLLGFKNQDYISIPDDDNTRPYIIQSEYRSNFKYNNYVVMSVDQFDINKSNANNLHKTFAVIVQNYTDINFADTPKVIKNFTPPIARLAKIKIYFRDRYGNMYDFQNMDHRLELLFTSFKQKRKYQNIFLNK